jgi:hypothetical protein
MNRDGHFQTYQPRPLFVTRKVDVILLFSVCGEAAGSGGWLQLLSDARADAALRERPRQKHTVLFLCSFFSLRYSFLIFPVVLYGYAIRKAQEKVGLKFIGTLQLLAYADQVNLLGDNTDTIKRNTETLIYASREVGLEVNVEKTKNKLLSRHHNAGQDIKVALF